MRCKSKALETGAILVDLPGTQDANAARSVIAKDYMKRCQAIWILAPITRAVDDKTAKDLLGDAFKSQLMMDGKCVLTVVVRDGKGANAPQLRVVVRHVCRDQDGRYCACVVFFAERGADTYVQSCNEIIRALSLDDEPELMALEDEIQAANVELKEQKKIKEVADAEIKCRSRPARPSVS